MVGYTCYSNLTPKLPQNTTTKPNKNSNLMDNLLENVNSNRPIWDVKIKDYENEKKK